MGTHLGSREGRSPTGGLIKKRFLGLMDVDGPPGFDSLLQGNKNIPGGKKGSKVELSGMCYHVYDNASGRYGMLSGTEGSLRSWACLLVLVIMKFCKERNDLKWLPLYK